MFPENLFGKCWWQEQENDSFWVKFFGILLASIKVGGGFHCKVQVNHRHTQVDPPLRAGLPRCYSAKGKSSK